ncbi:transglutaminase N-terminal domain-containing protein [Sphingomonas panni]
MRLSVHHETRYRFTEPQARIVQLLRLFPGDTSHQTVVNWRIDVDCDARLREGFDGYGNITRMLYAEGPVETLVLTVSGEALLTDHDGPIEGTDEPFPLNCSGA